MKVPKILSMVSVLSELLKDKYTQNRTYGTYLCIGLSNRMILNTVVPSDGYEQSEWCTYPVTLDWLRFVAIYK